MAIKLLQMISPESGTSIFVVPDQVSAIVQTDIGRSAIMFKGHREFITTDLPAIDIANMLIASTPGSRIT